MITPQKPDQLHDDLRNAWHRFIDMLVPLRPDLYGYCRRLAGNVWDAEDLVQDTLLRAFGQWGVLVFFVTRRGREALQTVMRLEEQDGRIARLRAYGFCPETMRAIGETLGVRVRTGIYRAPTPASGADWPDPAFPRRADSPVSASE